MFSLDIGGNALQDLKRFQQLFGNTALTQIMFKAGSAAGVAAESVVSSYPPQAHKPLPYYYTRQRKDGSTYKSKFKTMKQQRYVMRLASLGLIPYRRTGLLGRSITSEARNASANGVDVVIGTNTKYTKYVIGEPPTQNFLHQGVWKPLAQDVRGNLNTITDAFTRAALRGINDYLDGQ